MNSTSVYAAQDYRTYLKSTLADKVSRNPQFSLRAFADYLGISHAALSQVFQGKKNISFERAVEIANRLGLTETEKDYFCTLVQFEAAKSPNMRDELMNKLSRLRPSGEVHHLEIDQFKVIADWYHLPILNMTFLKDFEFNAKNVAERIGISTIEAELAIDRLLRVGMLDQDETGRYFKSEKRYLAATNKQNGAIRRFHTQMFEKAAVAHEAQSPAERITGTETFAFSTSKIERARELSELFFQSMIALAGEDQQDSDEIYHLQVNCFRLTQPHSSSKKNKDSK